MTIYGSWEENNCVIIINKGWGDCNDLVILGDNQNVARI